MDEKPALFHTLPNARDGAASEARKIWTTPQLRTLPVVAGTKSGVKPSPNETTFYFNHS